MVTCPECHSPLDIDPKATTTQTWVVQTKEGIYTEERTRMCTAAFCTGCEFVHEIKPEFRRGV